MVRPCWPPRSVCWGRGTNDRPACVVVDPPLDGRVHAVSGIPNASGGVLRILATRPVDDRWSDAGVRPMIVSFLMICGSLVMLEWAAHHAPGDRRLIRSYVGAIHLCALIGLLLIVGMRMT